MEEEEPEKFYREFSAHLSQIDELANVILRGHLLVERDLDAVIEALFFYPEYVKRLRFERKAQIARAMALRTQTAAVWDTLAALNLLRNGIAHNIDAAERRKRLDGLRRACMNQLSAHGLKKHEDDTDKGIVILGSALCSGYLGLLEEELIGMHSCLRQIDEQLHPDAEHVPVKSVREERSDSGDETF
jgi:hypothetical protein